jgi:hypothetical protein
MHPWHAFRAARRKSPEAGAAIRGSEWPKCRTILSAATSSMTGEGGQARVARARSVLLD